MFAAQLLGRALCRASRAKIKSWSVPVFVSRDLLLSKASTYLAVQISGAGSLMRGKALDHSEVLAMIKHWIIDHVENHDLKIRDYLPSETSSVPITRNPVLLGTGG